MATPKLLHLRSTVQGKLPAAAAIEIGQIGVNYNAADPFLCIKDSAGAVIRISGATTSATAPAAPVAGSLWVDISGAAPALKVYSGTAWVAVVLPASTSAAGIVQWADAAAITAGTTARAVDAAQLKAAAYVLPVATKTVLGGVKVGTGFTMAGDGTLNLTVTGGLVYKGITDPTKVPPVAPGNGDVWIASVAGAYEATWGLTGIATKGEMLLFEGGAWAAVGHAASPIKPNWTAALGAADEILNIPRGTAAQEYMRWSSTTNAWVATTELHGGTF